MVLTSRTRVLLYVAFKEAAFSALSENEVVFSATGITAASPAASLKVSVVGQVGCYSPRPFLFFSLLSTKLSGSGNDLALTTVILLGRLSVRFSPVYGYVRMKEMSFFANIQLNFDGRPRAFNKLITTAPYSSVTSTLAVGEQEQVSLYEMCVFNLPS